MDAQNIKRHVTDIRAILDKNLPETFWKHVSKGRTFDGKPMLRIAFAPTEHNINGVRNQKPELMSFALWRSVGRGS